MKKFTIAAVTAVMLASTVGATLAEAAPRGNRDRERFVERYCNNHRGDRDCRDFRDNRRSWDDRRYNTWYRGHYRNRNDNSAAALFGLAAGAIVGAAAAGATVVGDAGHVARCESRYRSYDSRTDTYVINSAGDRARCRL